MFNVNLFADNHKCTLFNSRFKTSSLFTLSISSRQQYKVVSSAYYSLYNHSLPLKKNLLLTKCVAIEPSLPAVGPAAYMM